MTDTTQQQAVSQAGMHFRCDARRLTAVLESIERATERKTTIPILGCVLLSAAQGAFVVRGTDLAVDMSCQVPDVEVLGEGAMALRVAPLLAIVRSLEGQVEVSSTPGFSAVLRAPGVKARLSGLDPQHFPPAMVIPDRQLSACVPQGTLQVLVSQCDFAASQREDNRFSLSCLKFTIGEGIVESVGTDGHRLSHSIRTCPPPPAPMSFLISLRAAPVIKSLGEIDDQVYIGEAPDSICFSCGTTVLSVRKVVGQFPDWRKAFPAESLCSATLQAGSLQATLARINTVADKDHYFLSIFIPGTGIRLIAKSPSVGDIVENIGCTVEGALVVAAYNSDFLLEFLTRATGDVTLALSNEKGPLLLSLEGWRHVIMPMTIKEDMVPDEFKQGLRGEAQPAAQTA